MPVASDSVRDGQETDDDASWITVPVKANRRQGRRAADVAMDFHGFPSRQASSRSGAELGNPTGPATTVLDTPATTHAHIDAEHARVATRWREQPSYSSLADLILAQAPGHAHVSQAVCLGAGSFGGPLDFGESIRRAHIQTEAFLSIVRILSQHSGQPIACFFQEPLYSAADKAYLNSLGHTVIEAPAALQKITPTTLVFAIHLPTREYLGCLGGSLPAMLVGTTFGVYEE